MFMGLYMLMVAELIFSVCDLSWSASKKSKQPQAAKITLAAIAGFFLLINTIEIAVQLVRDIRGGFGEIGLMSGICFPKRVLVFS